MSEHCSQVNQFNLPNDLKVLRSDEHSQLNQIIKDGTHLCIGVPNVHFRALGPHLYSHFPDGLRCHLDAKNLRRSERPAYLNYPAQFSATLFQPCDGVSPSPDPLGSNNFPCSTFTPDQGSLATSKLPSRSA